MARDAEHCRRQDQTVGGDDHGVRCGVAQPLVDCGVAQSRRLEHLDAALDGEDFHRARIGAQAAASRPVRLRQNQRDVVPGLEQPGERSFSESRRAGED